MIYKVICIQTGIIHFAGSFTECQTYIKDQKALNDWRVYRIHVR